MLLLSLVTIRLIGCCSGSIMVNFDPGRYHYINQGCLTADGIEDEEELVITDVRT